MYVRHGALNIFFEYIYSNNKPIFGLGRGPRGAVWVGGIRGVARKVGINFGPNLTYVNEHKVVFYPKISFLGCRAGP